MESSTPRNSINKTFQVLTLTQGARATRIWTILTAEDWLNIHSFFYFFPVLRFASIFPQTTLVHLLECTKSPLDGNGPEEDGVYWNRRSRMVLCLCVGTCHKHGHTMTPSRAFHLSSTSFVSWLALTNLALLFHSRSRKFITSIFWIPYFISYYFVSRPICSCTLPFSKLFLVYKQPVVWYHSMWKKSLFNHCLRNGYFIPQFRYLK